MEEKRLQDIIKNNEYDAQKQICQILNIEDESGVEFCAEDQFPNNVFVDFTVRKGTTVYGLIETKGSNIGITDYLRGIGQVDCYSNYIKCNVSLKDYDMSHAVVLYVLPEDVFTSANFNLGYVGTPSNCVLVSYNDSNKSFRTIPSRELNVLSKKSPKQVATISTYYIRDTRIFELYIALRYVQFQRLCGKDKVDRKMAEQELSVLDVPDNRNWRNVFISLSSLGLTDSDNFPTEVGSKYANLSYEEFAYEIYVSYIYKYIDAIIDAIKGTHGDTQLISLSDLHSYINSKHGGREVLFLTESSNRYLSSWLNIMQDDYGCVRYEPHKDYRSIKIIYEPSLYNKITLCSYISKRSKAYVYIDRFNKMMRGDK